MLSKIHWAHGAFYSEVKRVERDANHSPPSSFKLRITADVFLFLHKPLWNGA